MATLKELLGESYKDGMTFEEAENVLSKCNLADLNKGEYVSKAKYAADTKALADYKAQAEGKQAEIDAAVAKAIEKAKAEAKTEYDKQLIADKRKRAKEKAYTGYNEEQKGVLDAFIKDDELQLTEDGESYNNFEEVAKAVKEKFKSLFPKDDGSNDKGGLPPAKGQKPDKFDEFKEFVNLK